jgi:hypothetical protein
MVGVHDKIGISLGMEEGPYNSSERGHGRPKPNFLEELHKLMGSW